MDPTETCASCQKSLSDPKTLPCLHSLCTPCIEALVNDTKKAKEEDQKKKNKGAKPSQPASSDDLCCPQCSAVFVIPAGGVAALSADSYVLGVANQKESASKINPNDVKCGFCDDEPAVTHCASCDLFFGEVCRKGHAKSKANASHVVVKVDVYFKGSGPTTRVLFCQHHPGSEINTFCKTDDQPMCAQCVVPGHVSHQVVQLKDISLDFSAEITKALQPVRLSSFFGTEHHSRLL